MRALRPVIRHPKVQDALCWLVALYVRLVRRTGRWTITGDAEVVQYLKSDKPFIVSFWHGRLLMIPYAHDKGHRSIDMLISNHSDGRLIAKTIGHLGIGTIVGSTSRGGAKAARALTRRLRSEKGIVGITPDGPRGPRMRASNGVVALARLAQVPVFAVAFSANRAKRFESWDRFLLPYPFSRGVFAWSTALHVPKDADAAELERKRIEIESALTAVQDQCDELMGRSKVQPEPAAELAAVAEC